MQSDLHFIRSLPLTAAALGDKLGVRVLLGGDYACTDGKVIRLPAASGVVSEEEMLGYVMHEAAHIRLTDFDVIADVPTLTPIRGELVNALEDVRIENEFERLYEGARMILDGCREVCVERLMRNVDKFEANPAGTLGLYSLCHGHVIWTGLDYVEPLHEKLGLLMEKHFGAAVKNRIDAILGDLPKTRDTKDVAALVDRIFELLKSNARPQGSGSAGERPQGSGESSGNQGASDSASQQSDGPSGQDGESLQSGEAGKKSKNSGKSSDASDPSGSQQNEDAQNGSVGQSTNQSSNPNRKGKDSRTSQDAPSRSGRGGTDACRRALCAREDEFDHGFDISRTYGGQIAKAGEKGEFAFGQLDDIDLSEIMRKVQSAGKRPERRKPLRERTRAEARGVDYIREALDASSAVRRAIKGIVEAKSRRGTWTARQGQRISTTSAARLAVWNTRVFEKRREVKAVDTALHVLLDLSGSMAANVKTARRAALTLTAALMGVPHVNPALSSFNGNDSFRTIVPHGAISLSAHEGRIGEMTAVSSTPLHEAMLAAGIALSRTRETKKAILVVTDGFPDFPAATALIARELRASGVRLYGLGIRTEFSREMRENFDLHATIHSMDDLEAALLQIGAQVAFEANGAGRA